MSCPSVSIVTPSYNQRGFIEETLDSISIQTYSDIQHIVIDGGSTDGTRDVLEDQEGIDWISEADEGQSDAINKGLDLADGDIIGWLNSDDVFFDIEVVERVVRYFDNSNTDVLYGDVALIGPDSTILSFQIVPDFDYDRLLRGCFIEQPAVFFHADVLADNRLNEMLDYVMDYELWLKLSQNYEFRHVADVLAADRYHRERKIIANRNDMQKETKEVQRQYGNEHDLSYEIRQVADTVFDGIPRAIEAIYRGMRLRKDSRELAFGGTFAPPHRLFMNSFQLNKNLVPEVEDDHK